MKQLTPRTKKHDSFSHNYYWLTGLVDNNPTLQEIYYGKMNQPGLLLLIIMWLKCGFRGRLNLLRERQSLNNVTRAVQGLRMSPERPFKKNNVFLAMLRSLTGFQA